MALRKVKGAEQGVEFPFEPREVTVGETKTPDRSKHSSSTGGRLPPLTRRKRRNSGPRACASFKRALDKTLGDRGKRMRPFADGPEVLAAASEAVRTEFIKAHPGENRESKAKAFKRAIIQAVEKGLICAREIEAESHTTFIWRMDVK